MTQKCSLVNFLLIPNANKNLYVYLSLYINKIALLVDKFLMGVQIVKNAQNCNVTSCKVLENISNNCPVSDPRRKHIGTVKVSISDSNIHDIFSLCSYRSFHLYCSLRKIGWLVVLMIYIVLAIFQPYRDLEAGR